MSSSSDVPPRWKAAIQIQSIWRRAIATRRFRVQHASFKLALSHHIREADRNEAALLIQTQIRIYLAKKRIRRLKELRDATLEKLTSVSDNIARLEHYVHPDDLPSTLFTFKQQPPGDDEVFDLFDAIDVAKSGVIPRIYAQAVFDRLLIGLHPGDSSAAFDRALPTSGDWITPSALYFVIVRALAT